MNNRKFDYNKRIHNLKSNIVNNKLDAFIVTDTESIYYLTGASYKPLERPFFIIVWATDESPTLLVPQLEKEHMKKANNFDKIESYWDYPSKPGEGWMDKINDILKDTKTIGIEPTTKIEIAEILNNKSLKVLPLIENLRKIKTTAEINAIKTACKFADYGMNLMCSNLYYGITPLELFSLSKKVQTKILKEEDYDPLTTEILTACWPAPSSSKPHSVPILNDKVKEGPTAMMSFLKVNGYAAECERTIFIKKPSNEIKEIFHHMTEARKIAFNDLKPGISCSDIDYSANNYLIKNGFQKYLLHRVGHGIGLGNHEGPWISEGSEDTLQTNMIISIEPAIYIPEIGGFRHSDTVLITKDGYECLTKYTTDYEKLIIEKSNFGKQIKGKIIKKYLNLK